MLKGAIFDWDGVIVDSSKAHEKAWERLADETGLPLPQDHFKKGFGKKNQVIIPDILEWTRDSQEIARLGARKEELYRDALQDDGLKLLPGVKKLLSSLADSDIPRAVGTSTDRKNVDCVIDLLGLKNMFDAIVAADDVDKGKPDPAVFLQGAARINADPSNCVVFEDATYGIDAALKGGMKAVALLTTHPAEHFGHADLIVQDLSEVHIELLFSLWEAPS